MNHRCVCGGLLFNLLAFPIPAAPACADERIADGAESGFADLFNGRDLSGWWGLGTEDPAQWRALAPAALEARRAASRADIAAHWRVEDGALVTDGQGLHLTTQRDYRDFELHCEYRTVAGADSGIYLRGIPQVQIWDTTEAGGKWPLGADKGSGGLWNNAVGAPGRDPLVKADRPFGEWNELRVVMVGERVTVRLNGRLVVDHARMANYFDRSRPLPRTGPIQLQTHGGEVWWRSLRIREIEADEACAWLAARGDEDFQPIFNGRDLAGWRGAVDHYEVTDGAVVCRAGHGGTLFTRASYADFTVRLEFRLPPGGNNGLAIRYPGHGDPAYAGMCELQVLDDSDPRYASLDPRQYHGSAYGQLAAARGYLNPAGAWNFQEVTVIGSHVRVELNGTVILDGDLAAVSDLMYPREQFDGRQRREGHFGFCGHGDPVAFRRVRIRAIADPRDVPDDVSPR